MAEIRAAKRECGVGRLRAHAAFQLSQHLRARVHRGEFETRVAREEGRAEAAVAIAEYERTERSGDPRIVDEVQAAA